MFEDLIPIITFSWLRYLASLRGHVAAVYQIAWSADSRLLVSGSSDSTLKVWDVKAQKLAADLPGHADEVWLDPCEQRWAGGGLEAWPSRPPPSSLTCLPQPPPRVRCMLSTGVQMARGWQVVARTNASGCECVLGSPAVKSVTLCTFPFGWRIPSALQGPKTVCGVRFSQWLKGRAVELQGIWETLTVLSRGRAQGPSSKRQYGSPFQSWLWLSLRSLRERASPASWGLPSLGRRDVPR